MYKHLLIATDGSDLATKAVEQGVQLAKTLGAPTTIVTVTEPWSSIAQGEVAVYVHEADYEKATAENAGKILGDASAVAAKAGTACNTLHVKNRFPADGILHAAEAEKCDLIVMASHGRRGLTRLLLGS
jgi:nucleotide-binding universal stress UspA family protein